MNILSAYLQKIRGLLKDKGLEKGVIIEAVKEIIFVDMKKDDVKITEEGVVYIKGSASLKNAIFLKKKEIIARCREGGIKTSDFR